MKVLFIGGTGNISTSVSKSAIENGIDLCHLNRGNRPAIKGARSLQADISDKSQSDLHRSMLDWANVSTCRLTASSVSFGKGKRARSPTWKLTVGASTLR